MIHDAQVYTQPGTYSPAFRLLYRWLLPALGRRSQVVLTVSEYSRLGLEKHGVVPPGKAHVVHNGVDHFGQVEADATTLARHGLAQQGYFLAIGSLAPHKNLKMLVNAARARKDKTIPLIIAGGKKPSVFKDEGLQEGDGVRFLGRVSDEELKALYQGASALLFPSITEGFGLPPLEAMSCGCPVVATTGGAVPEVCGNAVLYADPFRKSEWTNAMEKVAASPDLRQDFSQRGLARAQFFTWRRAAEQLLRILAD
jgi:glycosyltransferase involved in cell wall biosynthesis